MRMRGFCIFCIMGTSLLLFLISGCAGMSDKATSVLLQNPETMDFVKCTVDQWGTKASYKKNEACVEEYKRQGYVIWAQR